MTMFKRLPILIMVFLTAVPMLTGQAQDMTVEEAFLQEAMEMLIIRETSRSDSREQKLIALEYVGNALERGSTNDEIRATLEFLSLEGTMNQTRERGRLMNDYPEVRREAARYLGILGTREASVALMRITRTENEPMVLQEAIKSLGQITAAEDVDDAVASIVWITGRFNNSTAPDNLLALSAVDALGRISQRNNGIRDPNAIQLLIRISEGPYAPAVRERARQTLIDMRRHTTQGSREQ